jgi:hypothetical protein
VRDDRFRQENPRAQSRVTVPRCLLVRIEFRVGEFFVGEAVEFFADDVGREAGGEEGAVKGGDFLFAEFAAGEAKFSFDAVTHYSGGIGFFSGILQSFFNVFVGDAAGAEIAGDAELPLFAGFGAHAGELLGVAGVVKEVIGFQTLDYGFDDFFVLAAAGEGFLHFVDGMGAAH